MSPAKSPSTAGTKRVFQPDETPTDSTEPLVPIAVQSPPRNSSAATSAFRNVSACNRCRTRKNRCDQRLPACSACEKISARCVGYDPITKREIPRSYVYFLETRLAYLENLLTEHKVPFDPDDAYDAECKTNTSKARSPTVGKASIGPFSATSPSKSAVPETRLSRIDKEEEEESSHDDDRLNKLVSNIGMVSVQGASDRRYLGATSGISFARVVLASLKSTVSATNSERGGTRSARPTALASSAANAASGGRSMRDSYFGLQTKPTIKEAPFPDRELGLKLVRLYFEHANPQIPTLHREEFMEVFDRAYSVEQNERTPRELYLLNIVFAIGAGIIWGSSDTQNSSNGYSAKRARLTSQQAQPEEYHTSAIVHLSSFLNPPGAESLERPGGDLEELQAVLLLAGFALLRPVAPGLWYITGVAVRLAVDLGLHYEEGTGIEGLDGSSRSGGQSTNFSSRPVNAQERGRRQWMRDLRRRLWWCTYTFDRLVSTCVGRPFGITDQVITTEFPSALDDKYITKTGFLKPVAQREPTYKCVAHHYFRLRLLQSEIVQVLQYQQAQQARSNRDNEYMHTRLASPFLIRYNSFRAWRKDVDQRLWEWKESAPATENTGVQFSVHFLELNYWQAVIMLYRQSLSVPVGLAGELSPTEEVASPSSTMTEGKEDEDLVFLKCAEAGQKTLKLYRQLHRQRLVNYTYLATHHLFMAGISFLYAVWHSPAVRSRLTLDDFDFTVLAATSVLGDLMEKCPPAEACRDAFERMSKATVQMCMSTPGFGFGMQPEDRKPFTTQRPLMHTSTLTSIDSNMDVDMSANQEYLSGSSKLSRSKRPPPKFDMDLRELFPADLDGVGTRPSATFPRPNFQLPHQKPAQKQQNRYGSGQHPSQQPQTQPQPRSQNDPTCGGNSQFLPHRVSDVNVNPNQNSYNPDFMSNLPGMDFLNDLASSGGSNSGNDSGAQLSSVLNQRSQPHQQQQQQQHPRISDSAVSSLSTSTPTSTLGGNAPSAGIGSGSVSGVRGAGTGTGTGDDWMDLGFNLGPLNDNDDNVEDSEWGYGSGFGVGVGMGLDFNPQHDWSDGQGGGFDLFDGFFFGDGTGGGGGGGGGGMG